MKVDLHMHSWYSDGEDPPAELVKKCGQAGAKLIALTDHDTVSGVREFLDEAKRLNVPAISGIELSALSHKEVHILGYNVDYRNPDFLQELERIRELRRARNSEILRLLAKYNVFITEKDVAPVRGESVGRMHIARAMRDKGYVATVSEAFDKWLSHGKRAYVPSYRLTPEEAVSLIVRYGGRAVLAHPLKLDLSDAGIRKLAARLKEYGLSGIEAYYVSHTREESGRLLAIAEELNLSASCGSDYHGAGRVSALAGVDNALDAAALEKLLG